VLRTSLLVLLVLLGDDSSSLFIIANAQEPAAESTWNILSYDNFETPASSSGGSPSILPWTKDEPPDTADDGVLHHHWCSTSREYYAYQGDCALRLGGGDADTVSAVVQSQSLAAPPYSSLRLTFWYVTTSVDGFWEHFILQVSQDDGATWELVQTWHWNVDFQTLDFQQASVILEAIDYNNYSGVFTDAVKFRLSVGAYAADVGSNRVDVDADAGVDVDVDVGFGFETDVKQQAETVTGCMWMRLKLRV
jgi:hypothetical protein